MNMQKNNVSRRSVLAGAALAGVTLANGAQAESKSVKSNSSFRFCLNTSTIRGQKKPLVEEIDIAAKAGYSGIEPWIREIQAYQRQGGKLNDLKKRIQDAGLKVESAIGFANWIVDDPAKRLKGLENAKRDMDRLRQIGGTRIAAPPVGATRQTDLNLFAAARRYGALLRLGKKMGVVPQVEVWGFSKSLSRLGEVLFVAAESGHSDACILPDVYHIYKGGSDFAGLELIDGSAIHAFHMNDYPDKPARDKIGDADRVYPGDGVAPLKQILQTLKRNGFQGALSLELFNRSYWKQDALEVAKTGLAKMKSVVDRFVG